METQEKTRILKERLSIGLLLLSGAIGVFLMVRWGLAAAGMKSWEPNRLSREDPCVAPVDPHQAIIEKLKKNNMFVPPPPKPQPPKQVLALFGDSAWIGNKWYEVGDTVPPGAKVKAIEATYMVLEWEGKEIKLAPIKAVTKSSAPPPPKLKDKPKEEKKTATKVESKAIEEVVEAPVAEDELAWLDIPDRLKEKVRKIWNQLPDNMKQQMKDKWESMSEEERERALEEIENMPDDFQIPNNVEMNRR